MINSSIPQHLVFRLLLFLIYINNLDLGLKYKVSKFANDTKVRSNDGNIKLQSDIDNKLLR